MNEIEIGTAAWQEEIKLEKSKSWKKEYENSAPERCQVAKPLRETNILTLPSNE